MVQQNEVVVFILGLGVLLFVVSKHSRFRELPSRAVFAAAYLVFLAGCLLTILEGLWSAPLLGATLNAVEHACYAVGSILLLRWTWSIRRGNGETRP